MMIKHDDDNNPPPPSTSVSIVVHYNLGLDSSHHPHHFIGDSDLTYNLFLDNLDLHIPEPFFYELLTLLATFVYSSLESTAGTSLTPAASARARKINMRLVLDEAIAAAKFYDKTVTLILSVP